MRTDLKTETAKPEEVTDSNYGRVLDQYISDMKHNDMVDREMRKMEIMEKNFQNGPFDIVFPWHMQLGRLEKAQSLDTPLSTTAPARTEEQEKQEANDFAYTPFKTFNRRRNYLIWMMSKKFDKVFTEEERELMQTLENKQFAASVAMKGLSLFTLMHLRFLWRPVGRPWLFDLSLIYFATYAFLGSNIPGVVLTWN